MLQVVLAAVVGSHTSHNVRRSVPSAVSHTRCGALLLPKLPPNRVTAEPCVRVPLVPVMDGCADAVAATRKQKNVKIDDLISTPLVRRKRQVLLRRSDSAVLATGERETAPHDPCYTPTFLT